MATEAGNSVAIRLTAAEADLSAAIEFAYHMLLSRQRHARLHVPFNYA